MTFKIQTNRLLELCFAKKMKLLSTFFNLMITMVMIDCLSVGSLLQNAYCFLISAVAGITFQDFTYETQQQRGKFSNIVPKLQQVMEGYWVS